MPSPRPSPDSKDPIEGDEIGPDGPEWISEYGLLVWKETVENLAKSGRPLLSIHTQTLIGFCAACSDLKEAGEILEKEGHLIDGGREGKKRHPAGSMRTQALTSVRAYAAELGLTPTSAGRLRGTKEKKKESPFAEFRKPSAS